MKNNTFYVYEHWRLDRDECFYVGKGKGNRSSSTKNRNAHHRAITAKLSREGYAMEVKIVAFGLSEDAAFDLEIERISFWRMAGVDLANILPGGQNGGGGMMGRKHSPQTLAKMSLSQKGRGFSEESKRKIGDSHRGKKHSIETRERMSDIHKGRIFSDETREKLSAALKGRTFSDEWRMKIGLASSGRRHSDETKKKCAEASRNRVVTDETREKIKAAWARRKAEAKG